MNSYAINLLPKSKKNSAGKLAYFFLHYFRYILVITQIVVISVFLYRLHEDQKVIELKRSYRNNLEILKIAEPIVSQAEAVEKRLSYIDGYLKEQEVFFSNFDYLIGIIPEDVHISNLSINKNVIEIKGISDSISSVRALNSRMQQKKELQASRIATIEKVTISEYKFIINASLVVTPEP